MDDSINGNIDFDSLKKLITEGMTGADTALADMRLSRRYYDGKQFTEKELSIFKSRSQAAIVINRIRAKTNGFKGLVLRRNKDPKAYPRTPKHEEGAQALTDGLRYVTQSNGYNTKRADVAENLYVEGIGGIYTSVIQGKDGEPRIHIRRLKPEYIIYDRQAEERDFGDARYKGYRRWYDKDVASKKFPGVNFDAVDSGDGELAGDEQRRDSYWLDESRSRVLIAHIFFKDDKDVWNECMMHDAGYIMKPRISPYIDEDGEPMCKIELTFLYMDEEGHIYGEVQGLRDLNRELNARRSKALHYNSSRQTYAKRGSLGDGEDLRRNKDEMNKPNGHLEANGEFGKDFGVIPTDDKQDRQFLYYQDAKNEIDAVSFNAQLAGQRSDGNLSGKAIRSLQEAGTLELEPLLDILDDTDIRTYRQIWACIKQFWTREKWVRVLDDDEETRFIGFNAQIPASQWLEEVAEDESRPAQERMQAAASLQYLSQAAPQELAQIIDVRNEPAKMDVDIILGDAPASINAQEEQFEQILRFSEASGENLGIDTIIEMSTLRNKKQLIDKIEKQRAQSAQRNQGEMQLQMQDAQAKTAKTAAEAQKSEQEAIQKALENRLISTNPDNNPQVSV